MKGSPGYVMSVAENAREALDKAILAENTACYWDGMNGTRAEADKAKEDARALIDQLERLAGR